MKQATIIFLFCLKTYLLIAQQTISKIIVDKETGNPVPFAHVFKQDDLLTGTVTNVDGKFVLKSVKNDDTLIISHLSYSQYKKLVKDIISDTIYLSRKTVELKEVIVKDLSPYTIMTNVIDNLKKNHFVEPVMYQMYGRIIIHNKTKSELHILSEQVSNVYYKKLGKHPFAQIIKLRIKPFSKIGKRYFKGMYMVTNTGLFSEVSFIFSYNPVFNKRKLKKYYKIEILGETNGLIKIKCSSPTEKYYTSILYIDKNSYAVSKIYGYRYGVEITSFKENDGKWYFNTYTRKYTSKSDKMWRPDKEAIYEEIALFNINKNTKFDNNSFKPERQIIAKKVKQFVGEWSDRFWDNYNYVPLPSWIEEKIGN